MHWLAIHLPRLPLEVFSRAAPDAVPLAVSDAGGRQLLRCNRPALARGVRPGLSPAAARALAADLRILARDPAAITMGQILEATIGPVCVVDCIEDPLGCPRTEFCECRVVYSLINRRISEVLDEYSLADLLDPTWLRSHEGQTLTPYLSISKKGEPGH